MPCTSGSFLLGLRERLVEEVLIPQLLELSVVSEAFHVPGNHGNVQLQRGADLGTWKEASRVGWGERVSILLNRLGARAICC